MRVTTWVLAAAALLLSPVASAAVVIYRCTDALGAVTVQNDVPCPKGTRQQRQVIEPPPPMPAYRSPPRVPEPAAVVPPESQPEPEPPTAPAERLPPPALFQCNTYDNDSYLSEDGAPQPRCVALQTTGLDGNLDAGAGAACQMVTDQCQRIADAAACDAWNRRLREAEAAVRFGRAEDLAAHRDEYQRVLRIVRDSTCGK